MTYERVVNWVKTNRYAYSEIDSREEAKRVLEFMNRENRARDRDSLHFKPFGKGNFLDGIAGEIEVDTAYIKMKDSLRVEIGDVIEELEAYPDATPEEKRVITRTAKKEAKDIPWDIAPDIRQQLESAISIAEAEKEIDLRSLRRIKI